MTDFPLWLAAIGFTPHGQSFFWESSLVWLHAVNDGIIALACLLISAAVFHFVRARKDFHYPRLALLFATFVAAIGLTHLLDVINIWQGFYYLSGWSKALTAALAITTVAILMRVIPSALKLTGLAELQTRNASLETRVNQAHTVGERLAAVAASSPDGIIGHTPEGVVTDWNPGAQNIFGYTAEEMIGQPFTRLMNDQHKGEGSDLLERVARGETIPEFETVRRHKDGSPRHVSIDFRPIRDSAGHIIGACKFVRDIGGRKRAETDRQEMDRKLRETQKLESLGVLAGGIAHDFNNLLAGILGNASLARADISPSSSAVQYLDDIVTASRRAAELCHQMLAYSGRGKFVITSINLNQLVEDTTHLLSISISKTCVLHFNMAPELPTVAADATQLRQIIMNLVINASEAIGNRSGVIAISSGVARIDAEYARTLQHDDLLEHGDYVFLEISDNGGGMDSETLDHIFDPFYTTKFTGRGLGLAAVLGIVRSHKGAMKVYSEPGRGSTFKLFLPCETQTDKPAAAPSEKETVIEASGAVLVVDDEETVRTVSARTLERLGYTVELAEDGRVAVEKYRADPSRYRLVLLDLTMPHLDGEETFRQLRHINPGVRVLLMSGFNEQEAVGRFTGKGLAGFVQKPFEANSLAKAIHRVLLAS